MKIKVGLVITQIVDLDFEQKSLNMNIEFIMRWTDELIKINPGYNILCYSNKLKSKNTKYSKLKKIYGA